MKFYHHFLIMVIHKENTNYGSQQEKQWQNRECYLQVLVLYLHTTEHTGNGQLNVLSNTRNDQISK